MQTKIIQRYRVNFQITGNKKSHSLLDLAKKHTFKMKGGRKELASQIDKILYGKK